MIQLVECLVRRDGYSHEEFVDRWQGEHADLARELRGLVRYGTSVATDAAEFVDLGAGPRMVVEEPVHVAPEE